MRLGSRASGERSTAKGASTFTVALPETAKNCREIGRKHRTVSWLLQHPLRIPTSFLTVVNANERCCTFSHDVTVWHHDGMWKLLPIEQVTLCPKFMGSEVDPRAVRGEGLISLEPKDIDVPSSPSTKPPHMHSSALQKPPCGALTLLLFYFIFIIIFRCKKLSLPSPPCQVLMCCMIDDLHAHCSPANALPP